MLILFLLHVNGFLFSSLLYKHVALASARYITAPVICQTRREHPIPELRKSELPVPQLFIRNISKTYASLS
jgi:hypothetical protein